MKKLNNRKNIRLQGYDYSKNGYYFVTICVKNKEQLLGKIVEGVACGAPEIQLTKEGLVIKKHIEKCKGISNVEIDEYVIMPNHLHMIIKLESEAPHATPTTIPQIISSFKTIVTKEIGYSLWQRNYYEHIIRNEEEYLKIKEYIINNPYKWNEDIYYTI